MPAVDRNLLRMAVGEMIGFKATPFPIVINEALEIGRRYSAPESINFLNGMLDCDRPQSAAKIDGAEPGRRRTAPGFSRPEFATDCDTTASNARRSGQMKAPHQGNPLFHSFEVNCNFSASANLRRNMEF